MVASRSEGGEFDGDAGESVKGSRRWRKRKIAAAIGLSLLLLLLLALIAVWVARRPIAAGVLENEFAKRGVEASYDLERVGLRTQVIRNLVIGDPKDPDLVARYALIQLRVKWNGSVEVYRIQARGVRLEGKLTGGKVSWGQLDKLLPPPSGKPFTFPDIVIDVADTSISLQTPNGPLGVALSGSGNLTGGFKGRMAASSPGFDFGTCRLDEPRSLVDVQITARHPHVAGPLVADRFTCPASKILISSPRFNIDSDFSEAFERFDGKARMTASQLIAGANGMAAMTANVRFKGSPEEASGAVDVAAQRSRLGPITADRTRVNARYLMNTAVGSLTVVGDYAVEGGSLASSVTNGVTQPLAALSSTPLGQVATAIGNAIGKSASSFDASGGIRLVNGRGGGAARIESADVRSDSGGTVSIAGGDGVTYYWPSGRLRIDSRIEMAGGGLPTGEVVLRQPRSGGPMSGFARLQPYHVGQTTLALQPIRFQATRDGATEFDTAVQLTGPFDDGVVRNLRLPLAGRFGSRGGFLLGRSCIVASFDFLRFRALQLGATRVPVCPFGQEAIVVQRPGGSATVGAQLRNPRFTGRLGSSPMLLAADSAQIRGGKDFAMSGVDMRLGDPAAPVRFKAAQLQGSFRGSGINGTYRDGEAVIGNVPLLLSDSNANWRFYQGDLVVEDELTLSDRAADPRFYPLHSDDFRLTLSGNDIRATGTLRHPASGAKVSDVSIAHDLGTGAGHADLDVPGINFGENLQPEELTRLTEGVIALVRGTVQGQGRIDWSAGGKVTSSGEFSTAGMDLAAPFGPVSGLTTTIHFTDLLGLETAPGQVATVQSINPGILVENGSIHYQLLPDQLVKVERGEWPFMGGRLILHETILNFNRPTPKRLTFEVVGFNAKTFIDNLGFQGIEITGTFDGVLPMIFDDEGGRIVGGRLEARPPGGEFSYTGTKPKAGLFAGVAFDLLSNIRYQTMIIRLDGDLAGEFATRFEIRDVSLGDKGGFIAGLVRRAFRKVPLVVNLNVKGPFRAIIQTAKAFKDPTAIIQPVMPFPLDAPGVVTETRILNKEEEQKRITPIDEIDVSTQPPKPSE